MRKQRGDTLIEVMIALAIIGSVIAISYATASRALRTGRTAQERTEALKYVEGQIETLKAVAAHSSTQVFGTPLPSSVTDPAFCIDTASVTSGAVYTEQLTVAKVNDITLDELATATPPTNPDATHAYDARCSLGADGRYKISIVRADGPIVGQLLAGQSLFTVRARWERLGGGKDEIVMYYKLHRGMF